MAFARSAGPDRVTIAAGRFFTKLEKTADSFPAGTAWSDTKVLLPPDFAPRRYVDLFTGCAIDARVEEGTARISMDEAFARMPISMLVPLD
jgi:maltooligosyltrehalose synthase